VHVEQNDAAIQYTGTWYTEIGNSFYGGTTARSITAGSRATFSFVGTGVKWLGYTDSSSGKANVYLDGILQTQVDTYSASPQSKTMLFAVAHLSEAAHTVVIEVTKEKAAAAGGYGIVVDAFEYLTSSPPNSVSVQR